MINQAHKMNVLAKNIEPGMMIKIWSNIKNKPELVCIVDVCLIISVATTIVSYGLVDLVTISYIHPARGIEKRVYNPNVLLETA